PNRRYASSPLGQFYPFIQSISLHWRNRRTNVRTFVRTYWTEQSTAFFSLRPVSRYNLRDISITVRIIAMKLLRITVGPFVYKARMETEAAPLTCAAFEKLLPWKNKLIHARWSGEAGWIPLGDFQLGVDYENHT